MFFSKCKTVSFFNAQYPAERREANHVTEVPNGSIGCVTGIFLVLRL